MNAPDAPPLKSRMLTVDEYAEEEKMLQQFPFYHGFLAREDLPSLLLKEGDYLMRVSEKDPLKDTPALTEIKKEIVLSVHIGARPAIPKLSKDQVTADGGGGNKRSAPLVKPVAEKAPIKHVIVSRKGSGFAVENARPFITMRDLIAYYSKNYGTLTKNKFILKQPILLQNWEHLHKDIFIDVLLGEGAFGEVRKGLLIKRWNGKKVDVAVKLLKGTSGMMVGKEKIKEMLNEARLMRNFKHRNVVRMYGVAVQEQPIYIILELIKGGALSSYLKKNVGNITVREKINMAYGAALGVEFLHKNNCIHRDLAARNCLYTENKIIKISDFGLSKNTSHHVIKSPTKLPIKWLAPETIASRYFNFKTDVYSYGVVLFEVFADGSDPWGDMPNAEVKKALKDGKFLVLTEQCPDYVKNFVHDKIYVVEHKRATMTEICGFFLNNALSELDKSMYAEELKAAQEPPARRVPSAVQQSKKPHQKK